MRLLGIVTFAIFGVVPILHAGLHSFQIWWTVLRPWRKHLKQRRTWA